ncbi:MAG: hypothetical protein ACRC62_21905 [Microcoleus sp.]
MTQSDYINTVRSIVKNSGIYTPQPELANLIIELSTGLPTPNAQLNNHGATIIYLHCRMRDDRNPTAVYQDGSDDVYFPLKGRLQAIADSSEIVADCADKEHDVNPESRLYSDFDSKLLLWPGQQLRATYNRRQGIFVPMIALPHPFDMSSVVGLKIHGSWKQGVS